MTVSQSTYTADQAVAEILEMHISQMRASQRRSMRHFHGEISTQSKAELEKRDMSEMSDLLRSFISN